MRLVKTRWALGLGVSGFLAALILAAAFPSRADDVTASNVVEQYQKLLDKGAAKLAYADSKHGYLPDLLRAFGIPRQSQLLVFSASSLQFDTISQKTPRALYYQDDISIGAVQGGNLIEIIVTDKESGVAFYTLDAAKSDKPRFVRRTVECTTCHGYTSRWVPGLMVASYATGPGGQLLNIDPYNPFHLTDDRTPFEDRYGGWYVTGKTGAMVHRGNVTLPPDDPLTLPPGGTNVTDLEGRIAKGDYLESGSDIVALMAMEHQAGFVNLANRLNVQHRGGVTAEVEASIDELLSYITFEKEAPLPSPVTGSSEFTRVFPAQGAKDGKGRSLRQFDLQARVFRYPLSYMIYSQAFDNLSPAIPSGCCAGFMSFCAPRGGAARRRSISPPPPRQVSQKAGDRCRNHRELMPISNGPAGRPLASDRVQVGLSPQQ